MIVPGPGRPPVVSRSTTQKDASSSGTRSARSARSDHRLVAESNTKLGSEPSRVWTMRVPSSGSEPAPEKSSPTRSRESAPPGRDCRNARSFSLVVARGSRANPNEPDSATVPILASNDLQALAARGNAGGLMPCGGLELPLVPARKIKHGTSRTFPRCGSGSDSRGRQNHDRKRHRSLPDSIAWRKLHRTGARLRRPVPYRRQGCRRARKDPRAGGFIAVGRRSRIDGVGAAQDLLRPRDPGEYRRPRAG